MPQLPTDDAFAEVKAKLDLVKIVGEHLRTFQEFPPRQKPGSFSVDQAMEKLTEQKGDN